MKNFLFEIHRSNGEMSNKNFSKIIANNNMIKFSKFLKIFN